MTEECSSCNCDFTDDLREAHIITGEGQVHCENCDQDCFPLCQTDHDDEGDQLKCETCGRVQTIEQDGDELEVTCPRCGSETFTREGDEEESDEVAAEEPTADVHHVHAAPDGVSGGSADTVDLTPSEYHRKEVRHRDNFTFWLKIGTAWFLVGAAIALVWLYRWWRL